VATFERVLESDGVGETIHSQGKRFYFVSGSSDLAVTINGKKNVLKVGQGLVFSELFSEVYLDSAVAQSVRVIIGNEELVGNEAGVSIDVLPSNSIACSAGGGVSLEGVDEKIIEGVAGQKELILKASRNNAGLCWVGALDEGEVNEVNGVPLHAGESIVLNVNCDVYVKGDIEGESNDIVYYLRVLRV